MIIAGAGPTGLLLACELRLAGVDTLVLERRAARGTHTKAMALHARSIEQLAMRGLAAPLLAHGVRLPTWHFGFLAQRIDFTVLDSPYPFVLSYPQERTEAVLEERARELGATIVRGRAVTGVAEDADGVTVSTDSESIRAAWVVGADGAGSAVRTSAGIVFEGIAPSFHSYLGDVMADNPPPPGFAVVNEAGAMMVAPMPGGVYRIAGYDPMHQEPGRREITMDELRDIIARIAGADFGIHDPRWLSRFDNTTRVAASYRRGRILLAGDAAHMHFPAGGVGLNLGLQDAMNLGWKLASVVHGTAAPSLLDSYDAERRPWGADVARHTMAQTALITATGPEGLALRELFSTMITDHPAVSLSIARRLSALDVHYPAAPDAHPLTGTRVAELGEHLSSGEAVLVTDDPTMRADGARVVPGAIGGARAALVRPDGYVGWAA